MQGCMNNLWECAAVDELALVLVCKPFQIRVFSALVIEAAGHSAVIRRQDATSD